jgi:hypothetical protein
MAAQHVRRAWPTLVGAAVFAASLALIPANAAAQDGPETPVLGLLQAVSEKRFEDLGTYFCPEFADQASGFDLGAELTASMPPGIDPQLAIDALTISVTGPSGEQEPTISVIGEGADYTLLGVEATMTVSLDPAASEPFVRAIVENEMQAQGMELTEESVQGLMAVVSAQLGDEVGASESISEVADVRLSSDGDWLICGGTIVEPDTLPQPSSEATAATSPAPTSSNLDAMPYADYVAALEAFSDEDPFAGMGDPPTKKEVLAGLERLLAMGTAEEERLGAVVPESCYLFAHVQVVLYWQSSMNAIRETAKELKTASLAELGSIVEPLDEALYQAHPLAYVDPYVPSGGFQGTPFNILAALATCEAPAAGESPTP